MPQPSSPKPPGAVRGSRTGRPIMALLDLLGRRWALRIGWELRDGSSLTFRELQASCDGASSSVVNERLRELRDAGIVAHEPEGYRLTPRGRELLDLLLPLDRWAKQWSRRR